MKYITRLCIPTIILSLLILPFVSFASQAEQKSEEDLIYQPGGMWMPHQIAELHGETLKKMGLEIDPDVFANPLEFPLNAIVHLGGCSASFISPDGLVITNYHCVRGYLQYNSTEDQNLLEIGYLAEDRSQEISAGPTARVYVVTAVTDITDRMRKGIEDIDDDLERYNVLEDREKKIIEEAEKATPNVRCEVAKFYGGGKYFLITKLEIKDVRLVYAPHSGIGEFGGDIDNWMWPRHTGDFALLRAYVGKDGKPADYSKDNVPFKPNAYLRIAKDGFKPGDLAFVVGFPGVTERLTTALEVKEEIEWRLPTLINLFKKHMDLLEEITEDNPELKIKAATLNAGLSNMEKKWKGTLEGAAKKDLVNSKQNEEAALQKWINATPEHKEKYGSVIQHINNLIEEHQQTREADLYTYFLGHRFISPIINAGVKIVRMAEERPKPDLERDPDYQKRNWQRLEQEQVRLQRNYSRTIEQAVFELNLKQCLSLPTEKRPDFLVEIFGEGEISDKTIHEKAEAIFDGTELEDQEKRIKLLNNASLEELKESDDTLIQFALKLSPYLESIKERNKRLAGAMILVRPKYYRALEAFNEGVLAPDANGTIRVSFGTVRGFRPEPDKEMYFPFTKVWQVAEKWARYKGEDPFDAPAEIINAIHDKRFGDYIPEEVGQVPVNFLTDLDITNGNSGSATLNANAEFAGIAFDGNIEGVASDIVFLEDTTRAIHVDVRYIKWVLDAVENADHLLKEMGLEPEFTEDK